jgi:hypothetical protein
MPFLGLCRGTRTNPVWVSNQPMPVSGLIRSSTQICEIRDLSGTEQPCRQGYRRSPVGGYRAGSAARIRGHTLPRCDAMSRWLNHQYGVLHVRKPPRRAWQALLRDELAEGSGRAGRRPLAKRRRPLIAQLGSARERQRQARPLDLGEVRSSSDRSNETRS